MRLRRAPKLSTRTGLTRSAVSYLTDELIQDEMIREVGFAESTGGRRGILLDLNPDGGSAIALKINASSVQCALANFTGEIDWYKSVPIDSTEKETVLGISQELLQAALSHNGIFRPVLGIGVAAPGLIGADGEMIYSKFMDWRLVDLRRRWEKVFGLPVIVDNLVSLAALGESRYGSAANDSHFMFIEIGYGAGAGIVINGQLYQGKNGFAGEVGYMSLLSRDSRASSSQNWQEMVNIPSFGSAVAQLIAEGQETSLAGDNLSFNHLTDALRIGDHVAIVALKKLSRYLGIGLANLYNAFDIPIYILGGEFGKAYEPFLGDVRDTMTGHLVQMPPSGIELRISRIQPDAALMGAVARVFDKILIEPSLRVAI